MATMINGIRILDKKDKTLIFTTYLLYIDFSSLPKTHGFGLMVLCDSCNEANNYKDSLLYKDLLANKALLQDYEDVTEALIENHEGAKKYIEELTVYDFKNFPLTDVFLEHEYLWHELNPATKTFDNEAYLPQATYKLKVTDKNWLAHIQPGEVWETTTCDFQGPYWYLEHHSDKSHKYYRIYMSSGYWVTEYGAIGKRPRIKKERFRWMGTGADKVKAKLRPSKGYQLVYRNFDTAFHVERGIK